MSDLWPASEWVWGSHARQRCTCREHSVESCQCLHEVCTWLQVTGAVGWRKEGIRYKKNEVRLQSRMGSLPLPCTLIYKFLHWQAVKAPFKCFLLHR